MDRKWLLLFKGNVHSLTEQVQQALFEQTVLVASEMEELHLLPAASVRQVVSGVFLWAANHPRYFARLSEEQTVEKLKELIKLRAMEKQRLAAPSAEKADPIEVMQWFPEAWETLSRRIRNRNRLHRIASRLGAVGFMAATLVTGGFLFGMIAPAVSSTGPQVSINTDSAPSADSDAPNGPVSGSAVLKEIHAKEHDLSRYADFKMGVPAHLPPGYAFDEGIAWLHEGRTKTDHTMLVYTNAQKHLLRVSYYKLNKNGVLTTGSFMPETRHEVFIRGTKALFSTNKSNSVRLDWTEDSIFISISGRELEEAELVKMAESLK